jgi:uncharacterized protein
MDENQISNILKTARTIAVVGLSSNPEKDSYPIAQYLQQQGYRIIPVNPTATEILGEKVYPDLLSIPDPVDVVQVFRPPEAVPPIVQQAIQIKAKVVWMQSGITNAEAAQAGRVAGLEVVEDRCMRVDHRFLMGPRKA